jgi:hypothetical protein
MGTYQLAKPGILATCQLGQLAELRTGPVSQTPGFKEHLDLSSIPLGHAVVTGDFMTERQYGAMQMKQRSLSLGLSSALSMHRMKQPRRAPTLKRQARKIKLLIGAGLTLISHAGDSKRSGTTKKGADLLAAPFVISSCNQRLSSTFHLPSA